MVRKLVAIFVLLVSLVCRAQNSRIRFEKVGHKEGLSSQQVTCVAQDKLGFIWIGTTFGLNRFDGISCKTYYHSKKDSNSLVNNLVLSIKENDDGKLWIGTQEGVSCFDPVKEKFSNYHAAGTGHYNFPKEFCFTYIDKENTVWIGHNSGVSFINKGTVLPVNIDLQLEAKGRFGNKFVTSFLHDKKGRFWVSTSYGIQCVDKNSRSVIAHHFGLDKNAIGCTEIIEDNHGRIFAGTWGAGVYVFNEAQKEFIPHTLKGSSYYNIVHNILPVTEAGIDNLLLGTEAGLIKITTTNLLNDQSIFEISNPDKLNPESISNGIISGLIRDRAGNIWIATPNGVNKINPYKQNNQSYPITQDPNYNASPTNICEDLNDSNKLWVSSGGKLFSYNKQAHEFGESQSLENAHALREMIKGKKFYWIATSNGLLQYDAKMIKTKHYKKGTSPQHLNTDKLYSVCEDHEGKIWIGTIKKGINVLDPSTGLIQKYLDDSSAMHLNYFVNKIIEDSHHNIWIGTTGGLFRYNRTQNKFELFRTNPRTEYAAASDNILSITETYDGRIWIGTRQGLRYYNYKDDLFTEIPVTDHGVSDFISGIIEVNRDQLWLASNNGLLQFNTAKKTFKLYNTLHGLPANDLSSAFERDESGTIYIGFPGKLTVLHPSKLLANQYTAPPLITGIAINNEFAPFPEKKLIVKYNQSLSINFVSLNYTDPENNTYAYQLTGANKEWINIGNNRSISFPGLQPGEYTLKLKAANNEGVWHDEITGFSFVVRPPFWKTWWFIISVILLIAAAVYSFYIYRLHQHLHMEKMRTRIATDLHDDIGATLSSISFYCFTVK